MIIRTSQTQRRKPARHSLLAFTIKSRCNCFLSLRKASVDDTDIRGSTDLTSPMVSGMSTSEGLTGREEVKIRASGPTRVNLVAANARKAIHSILVSDIVQDLALIQYNPDVRIVKAVWTMPSSTRFNITYGQVRYDPPSACGSQCFTSCCGTGSCEACTCLVSCFSLEYYDDLKPVISFSTALTGPEIGGTEILMTISKLPQVTSPSELSVAFDNAFADVFVLSSSFEETKLKIYTPTADMHRLSARTVPAQLIVVQRPDRKVDFSFEYTSVSVSVLSLSPSRGTSLGNQIVTVSIQYMPYPTVIGVDFDGITLAETNVTVMAGLSNKLRTVVSFLTPQTLPGTKSVSVYMKSDPFGSKRASFAFLQTDASQPTVVPPLPSSGPTVPPANAVDFLRVSNFPSYQVTMTVSFAYANGSIIFTTANASVSSASGGITTVAYMRPSSAEVTESIATLTLIPAAADMRAVAGNKIVSWDYIFFDDNAVRLLSRVPSSLPITMVSYGRTIALQPDVQVRIANFPQNLGLGDVTAVLGGIIEAQITSIAHTATCGASGVDCNRTIVTFKSPQISSPVDWPVTISAGGAVVVRFTLTYFSPCDFDAFCGRFQLVTDNKWLQDNPPSSALCVQDGACVDPNTLPQPSLRSMSPLFGTASGGTMITVSYANLPAFMSNDVVVTFGAGSLAVLASVASISPEQGSSLTQNSGVLRFLTPKVPGGNTRALTRVPTEISVSWGSIQRVLSTSFQYTPVVEGATVIDR
jgi:hypothetical protein